MHEQPSSLSLEEFMLLDDEDDKFGGNELDKLSGIQEQLQKQADLIRDLINQRDYLITQILHERERWQAERDGWDRTSEALIARYSRKANNSVKDEEMAHRCALYESDNKFLKEKVHDAQVRVSDLEAELSRLRPLLVIQPHSRPRSQQQGPRRAMPYAYTQLQNYIVPISHVPPPTPAASYVAFSPYTTSSAVASENSTRKRKRDDDPTGKGKEKEAFNEDTSDANVDDDSDNTDAPSTPTPIPSSASRNPYAYMGNFYRTAISPPKNTATLPPSLVKPPGSLNNVTLSTVGSSPTGAMSFNGHATAYAPFPFPAVTLPKQTPSSTPSRQGDTEKESSNAESSRNERIQSSPTPGGARKTVTTSIHRPQHGKYKTSSILSDARAEHLLLAARRIGRERAVSVAGLLKTWERSVFEEAKDKAKVKDTDRLLEANHGSASASRSATQRHRMPAVQSPTTPTPKRTHGHTKSLMDISSFALTPNATPTVSKTRETLFGSSRTPRSKSLVFNVGGGSTSKSDEDVAEATQTPLDSLLSAARTMMTEDRESRRTNTRKNTTPNNVTGVNEDARECAPSAENQTRSDKKSNSRRKRRRNNTAGRGTATETPRSRNVENHAMDRSNSHEWEAELLSPSKRVADGKVSDAMTTSMRTRSALEVLADQAAAAFEGSSTHQEMDHVESTDPELNTTLLTMANNGAVVPYKRPDAAPVSGNTAVETTAGGQIEASAEAVGHSDYERGIIRTQAMSASLQHLEQKGDKREEVLVAAALAEGPADHERSRPSDLGPGSARKDCDPFGGRLIAESGGDSECDLDAEGDIDPDSQDTSLDAPSPKINNNEATV